jgi:hypothetical protein
LPSLLVRVPVKGTSWSENIGVSPHGQITLATSHRDILALQDMNDLCGHPDCWNANMNEAGCLPPEVCGCKTSGCKTCDHLPFGKTSFCPWEVGSYCAVSHSNLLMSLLFFLFCFQKLRGTGT